MKTRHPADALDAMLESLAIQEERQPDEFTVNDILERAAAQGKKIGRTAITAKLNRAVDEDKTHERRRIVINGRLTSVYRVK